VKIPAFFGEEIEMRLRPQTERVVLAALIIIFIGIMLYALSGCQYQPPCPDCWLAVPKTQPARL